MSKSAVGGACLLTIFLLWLEMACQNKQAANSCLLIPKIDRRGYNPLIVLDLNLATTMLRPLRFSILFLFLFLSACLPAQETITPTPLTTGAPPTIGPQPAEPIPATIRELVLRPFDYENRYVRVTGNYKPHPPLVCGDAPRRSPASWELTGEEELFLQAGGFDRILRAAASPGLPLTVDGQWRRWRGQSGCGKQAAEIEIWYLDVIEIVSPNPLVYQPQEVSALSTVPPAVPTEIDLPFPPSGSETPAGDQPPEPPDALATPTLPGLPAPTVSGEVPTQPAGPPMQPTPTFSLPPTATSPAATTPTVETTPTVDSGTPAATVTADTGTPAGTDTVTPGATVTTAPPGSTADQGPLSFDELIKGQLAANTADLWTFEGSAGEVITITAIAPTDFNIVLTLRDPAGNAIISNQNSSPADQAEAILHYSLPVVGAYELLISEATGQATPYAVAINSISSGFSILQPGNLKYGSDIPSTLPAGVDHYWHFLGTAEETITVRVTVTDQSDLFIALYGPEMEELVTFTDEGLEGESEEFTYELTMTGYMTVYVAENFFAASNYRITLTKQ